MVNFIEVLKSLEKPEFFNKYKLTESRKDLMLYLEVEKISLFQHLTNEIMQLDSTGLENYQNIDVDFLDRLCFIFNEMHQQSLRL